MLPGNTPPVRRQSDDSLLRRYEPVVDAEDLHTSTLGLDFRLRSAHFGFTGQVVLKCTAEIESTFYQSANIRIVSRTMATRSRSGAGGKDMRGAPVCRLNGAMCLRDLAPGGINWPYRV